MSAELVTALPNHYYTDPAIFEQEKEKLFYRTWQYAGHVSSLRNPGDYITTRIGDQSVFISRGKDNALRAFYNVCQHRAHELLEGQGNTSVIVCPYHTWAYQLSGELIRAPHADKVPGFDKGKVCLTPVRLENFHGFLFLNLDDSAPTMDELYPQVREQLAEYLPNLPDLKPVLRVSAEEACNWKVSIENYSECYHCAPVHQAFTSGVIDAKCYDIRPQGYCLRHQTVSKGDKQTYAFDASVPHANDYSSWFLWPMFSFQVYPGNELNTYLWEPVDHENVRVHRDWFSTSDEASETTKQVAELDRNTTVAEDILLVNSVQKGLKSKGYRPGPLVINPNFGVNSEHTIQSIKEWTLEAMQ
ncbi:MAG: aromatic ring-hydroxylating dioxygenase subunit alpha [Pseudomonadota bacterium]